MKKTNEYIRSQLEEYQPSYYITIDVDQELDSLLKEMEDNKITVNNQHLDTLTESCKTIVIDSIVGPFGLSRGMFNDKDGGNVTTLQNAKNDVFATKEDEERFNREYISENYHGNNENYKRKRDDFNVLSNNNELRDVYNSERNISGKQFNVDKSGNAIPRTRYDTEHIVASKEIHDDPRSRLFMSEKQSTDLANNESNLGATLSALNQSKKDQSFSEWAEKPSTHDKSKKNDEAYGVNRKEADQKDHQARKKIDGELRKEGLKKYAKEIPKSGVQEGLSLGMRQAIGVLLMEMTEAVFFELQDLFKNGNSEDISLGKSLKLRLERVASKVKSKWKDALHSFKDGAINGFISNLITVIVNSFVTTVKRTVRIIRDGFNSLVKAVTILANPSEEMTTPEAAIEASKIIAASITTIIGLLIEESIQKFIESVPFLVPIASYISPVLTGIITGMATVLIIYAIDQLKNKIEFRIQQQVNVESGMLAIKYKTIQTMVMIDKSIYFTKKMKTFIDGEIKISNEVLAHNKDMDDKGEREFYDLLKDFKSLSQ